MADILEIRVDPQAGDSHGRDASRETGIEGIESTKLYRYEGEVSDSQVDDLARVVADPVTDIVVVRKREDWDDVHTSEVSYRPGVTNPESRSLGYVADLLGIEGVAAADSSRDFHFPGDLNAEAVETEAKKLINPTVQIIRREAPETLIIDGETPRTRKMRMIRGASGEQLAQISQKEKLYLSQTEMRAIQAYYRQGRRDPTDVEMQTFGTGWSEHCLHKAFNRPLIVEGQRVNPLFPRLQETSARHQEKVGVVTAFKDNAGGIRFYEGMVITGKVETHNSPAKEEPYGGAATGTGGVIRDILGVGKGGKPILSTDMFCHGPLELTQDDVPEKCFTPEYLLRRVIEGVRDYGNRIGVPTANGSIHLHPDFRAKPSVIVGAYGIQPESTIEKGQPQPGDLVVAFGGRTGRDGIHGVTFASVSANERTGELHGSSVQIGNPIEEKRVIDAVLEARDAGCLRALTDCGGAGFASAMGEMGEDTGIIVDLAQAPLKYPGLAPWEIWISESQERMVGAVPPEKIDEFMAIAKRHGVEATVMGWFTDSQKLQATYGNEMVLNLDYDFYRKGVPLDAMVADWQRPEIEDRTPEAHENEAQWLDTFSKILRHGDVCSKEAVVRQYDHEVQGGDVEKPYAGVHDDAPNNAVVLRPMLDRDYGFVQAHGMNPVLNILDPYRGSKWAVAEAVANFVSVGGDLNKAAFINNFITGTPTAKIYGTLNHMVNAICEAMDALEVPVVSGKDSLSSTYEDSETGEIIEIPPVLTMSIFGGIENVRNTVSSDIKKPGESVLVLVGKPDTQSMGGSTYHSVAGGQGGEVPDIDLAALNTTARQMFDAIQTGKVLAAHDISQGGLAVTLAEMSFGGDCGAKVHMNDSTATPEQHLFNETAGCFVVEVSSSEVAQELFGDNGQVIGTTEVTKEITYYHRAERMFTASTDELKAAWKAPMEEFYGRAA